MSTKSPEIVNSVVWGFGFQFVPGQAEKISRTVTRVKEGVIRGLLILKPEDTGVRTVFASRTPLPEERVYGLGEIPGGLDISKLLNALMEAHPIGSERLLRRYKKTRPDRKTGAPFDIVVTELAAPFYYKEREAQRAAAEAAAKEEMGSVDSTELIPDNTEATLITPETAATETIHSSTTHSSIRGRIRAGRFIGEDISK